MKNGIMKKLLPVFMALVLVAGTTGLGTLKAHGVVDPVHNVTQNTYFATIQGAIDDADAGDVIEVLPGTYTESLAVTVNDLTIRSTMGADVTDISGGTSAVQVEVKDFVLDGFTVSSSEWAVNVLDVTSGDITLQNCVFESAMYATLFAKLTDTSIHLIDNEMSTTWRGFYFDKAIEGSDITVSGNDIANLHAEGSVHFVSTLDDCVVEVSDNHVTNSVYGVYANAQVKDTQFDVIGNTVEGGVEGVYTNDAGDGICGTSVLTVHDNTFIDQSDCGVNIGYVEDNGSAEVSDNVITNSGDSGVYVDYVGYSYPDAPATVTISGNTMNDCYYGVYLYDVCYGTAIVEDNTIKNADTGVYVDYSADESATDVQILDNTITVDDSMSYASAGIYVYSAEKSLLISGNSITGYSDVLEEGIYLDYIGYYGSEASEVEISDNFISTCEYGIDLYDVADELETSVLIAGNEVTDTEYGVYIENMDSYAAEVTMIENTIYENGYGVYVDDLSGEEDYEVVLAMSGNLIKENETGIFLNYIYLYQSIPGVVIMDNAVVDNGVGLAIQYANVDSNDLVLVLGNNFSGNEMYGVQVFDNMGYTAPANGTNLAPADTDFVLQAQWNWWGDPSGPEYMGNEGTGDGVIGPVAFDPWIEKLILSPKDSSGFQGKARTFTATLLDSDGDPVELPLTVLFRIAGANDVEGSAALENGVAKFSYTSQVKGTDTVFAGLSFAGALVEDLTPDANAVWLAAATDVDTDVDTDEEGNPDTGDSGFAWFAAMMALMALAGASGTVLFRKNQN